MLFSTQVFIPVSLSDFATKKARVYKRAEKARPCFFFRLPLSFPAFTFVPGPAAIFIIFFNFCAAVPPLTLFLRAFSPAAGHGAFHYIPEKGNLIRHKFEFYFSFFLHFVPSPRPAFGARTAASFTGTSQISSTPVRSNPQTPGIIRGLSTLKYFR
jgi:hypothetical protein